VANARETLALARAPIGQGLGARTGLCAGACCLVLVVVAVQLAAALTADADSIGTHVWYICAAFGALACALAGAFVLRRSPVRLAAVLGIAAAIQLAPVASPLLLSRDAYAYWAYGRIAAVHDGNPYRQVPVAFARDPAVQSMARGWRRTTSVYGPLFTIASEGGAAVGGRSATVAATLYQAAGGAGVLALAALVALLSPAPAFAAAVVGWNPLLALDFGGGGHNDVWMMVPLLAALACERHGRRRLAGALWACSAAIKWIPLLLLPLRAAGEGAASRRRFSWAAFATTAAVIAAASSLLYGSAWLHAFQQLLVNAGAGTRSAAPHLLRALGLSKQGARLLVGAVFVLAYLALARQARRGRVRLGLAAGAFLLATPWLFPWYAAWSLPLAAAEDDAAALWLALGVAAYLLVAYPRL
jgi:hypothetical protein